MFSGILFTDFPQALVAQAAVVSNDPWYVTFLPLLMLVAAFVLCIFGGNALARSLRLPDYGTRLSIIFAATLCAILVIATNWPPRFGVDLRGGINYVGQLDLAAFTSKDDAFTGRKPPEAKDIIPNLRNRVDPSGTREIIIRPLGADKIEVIMPQVDEAEADAIWNRLAQTGHLLFRIVADQKFHSREMNLASEQAAAGNRGRGVTASGSDGKITTMARWYDLARETPEGDPDPNRVLPIKFVPGSNHLVRNRETGQLIDMNMVPFGNGDPGTVFANWLKSNDIRSPQILMVEPRGDRNNVEGEHLSNVMDTFDERGRPCVTFGLTTEGAKRMGALTTEHKPRGNDQFLLGIVLDDALHSAPSIEEPIFGNGRITGSFTRQEVQDLRINLEAGKISVALVKTPISKQYLESTLGAELKNEGLIAIGISMGAVLLFMLFYYRAFAGSISCLALLLNLVLTLSLIMAIKQPLTLTGLAGLVLTIGMSVDANVLIFERIREEMGRGASLRIAIQNGFERAFGTIIDSNVTTLLTAIVLYVLGTDQIKGFSVTLIIGILTSMFTAVFVSRTIFDIAEKKHWLTKLSMTKMFPDVEWNFMSKFRITSVVSIVLIVIGMVSLWSLGSRVLDIDLRGGSTAQVIFNQPTTRADVEKALAAGAIRHNDEPVDFVVSELRSDDGSTGKEFKIDSSIPSYDETAGPRWAELDEVLSNVFAGKLRQRKVTFDPSQIIVTPKATRTSSRGQGDLGAVPVRDSDRLALSAGPSIDGGLLRIQDQSPVINQEQTGAGGAATAGDAQAAGQEPPAQEPPAQEPPAQETPPVQAGGEAAQAPADLPGQMYSAVFTLEFDNPISAKSIVTQLVEASRTADRLVEEGQFTLAPVGANTDELIENLHLNKWQVTMETPARDDAAKILEAWSTGFNQLAYFKTSSGVGSQIASSMQMKAFAAILASLLGIIAYIWVRFQNVAFGIAAVVALIHDVLIVLGAIAISHYVAGALGFLMVDKFKISLQIVAALLTVIGYSLNDTIVIFDRIREVRGKRIEMTGEMVNRSVSQTLSRTILTSLTTLVVVVLLYFIGGPAIHGFAFSLVIGVIAGTYSTVFVASPILVWLMNRFGLNAELNAELMAAKT